MPSDENIQGGGRAVAEGRCAVDVFNAIVKTVDGCDDGAHDPMGRRQLPGALCSERERRRSLAAPTTQGGQDGARHAESAPYSH